MTSAAQLITQLLDGRTGGGEEKQILEVLRSATADELNDILTEVNTGDLFASVDDRLVGPDRRKELIQLLCYERVKELNLHAVAALIGGLQVGHTEERDEQAIVDLVSMYSGNDLTHLKNTINLAKGRHDLEGLVFRDIDNEDRREQLLAHFAASSSIEGKREAKVLSDIDDTAIARIHEKRYPKGTVIPGILPFYEALDIGPDDAPISRGDLTFVTARPSDAFGLMKGQSRKTLTEAGVTDLSIMTGSWFNLASHDSMAAKKLENIAHYAKLYPEYDLVFIGDSGQGDIIVGERMVETYPDVVKAVFIHDVVQTPDEERKRLADKGIWLVDTYVGAATKAHELGLVSDAGLRDVIDETSAALNDVAWEGVQEQTTRAIHATDAEAARARLGE